MFSSLIFLTVAKLHNPRFQPGFTYLCTNHSHETLFTLILLYPYPFQAQAQYDPSKVDKKAAKYYLQSQQQAGDDNFPAGIESLKKAVAIDSRFEDGWLSMAGMYGELKNYQAAVDNYQIARAIDSIYFKDFSLSYSINLAGLGKFEECPSAVNDFKSIPNLNASSLRAAAYRSKCYQFAMDYAAKIPLRIINSNPVIWATVSIPPFLNISPPSAWTENTWSLPGDVNGINEDFYQSDKLENGWSRQTASGKYQHQ